MNGPLATALLVAVTLACPAATAANGEQFCTHGGQKPEKGDSVACYSDAGCRFAGSLGAEPVRGYDQSSAPFALARGKITGIVTSSSSLIAQIRKVGGACRRAVQICRTRKQLWRRIAEIVQVLAVAWGPQVDDLRSRCRNRG